MHMAVVVLCFNDTATPEIYTYGHTRSLHDALPISLLVAGVTAQRDHAVFEHQRRGGVGVCRDQRAGAQRVGPCTGFGQGGVGAEFVKQGARAIEREAAVAERYRAHGECAGQGNFGGAAHALQEAGEGSVDFAQWRRSEEHTSELQSLMRISYAVFCLKKKK